MESVSDRGEGKPGYLSYGEFNCRLLLQLSAWTIHAVIKWVVRGSPPNARIVILCVMVFCQVPGRATWVLRLQPCSWAPDPPAFTVCSLQVQRGSPGWAGHVCDSQLTEGRHSGSHTNWCFMFTYPDILTLITRNGFKILPPENRTTPRTPYV